ncbi:hypothetical protein [Paractinoplanes aksuensis]|uniref:hypothetical protein n=1 Tax=Paractinoplanes aksuensis TaxID=2939490 RepID=UPI00209BF970|nr:hypothetical protein [Actinoplanes aksuensis]
MSRALRCAVTLTLAAASAVALAEPARAMNYSAPAPTTWTFTDSAAPTTRSVEPTGDAPVGSTVDSDGVTHTRRAYYTFDITPFRGQVVHAADLWTRETRVADCGTAAPVEVWRTGPVTAKSTWSKPPQDLELVARRNLGLGTICPRAILGAEAGAAVTAALARNEKTITFGLRLAAGTETDPEAARSFEPLNLSMSTNYAPTVSNLRLTRPDRPCGTPDRHPTAGGLTYFTASAADKDPVYLPTTAFELWPVDRPEERTRFAQRDGADPVVSTDLRTHADGTVLAWSAQARDNHDEGEWGPTCYLTVDNTAPATAPAIIPRKYNKPEYPGTGGPGVAGTFILDARGDTDTVGFEYTEQQSPSFGSVDANRPGGRARITVTPSRWGSDQLQVRAVDRAGNRGPWQTYDFYVRDTAPSIEVDVAGVGRPSTIKLFSQVGRVTSFGYSIDGGPETRVPATDRHGSGPVVFASSGYREITSRSYVGTKMIGTDTKQIYVDDAPAVASAEFLFPAEPVVGDRGTFTFKPRTTGVVAYLYDFGDGDRKRVEAAADGTATLEWTAGNPGYHFMTAVSVTADGTESAAWFDQFRVIDTHPAVWSDAGSCCPNTDGVGRPVTVNMNSELAGVTGFVYSYDGGAEQTVSEGQNSRVKVTPTHAGDSPFTARAVRADGTLSPPTTITIKITDAPLVTHAGPYGADGVVGRKSVLTFEPATPNVASYQYYWGYYPESPVTVDAGADGSATVEWTPEYADHATLSVVALAADGGESDVRRINISAYDQGAEYSGTWDDSTPRGGVGVPGRVGFSGLRAGLHDATVKYLWRVNDGPVHELARDKEALVTEAPYTPERTGENVVSVQRQFTDGLLSPVLEYRFLVGTRPLVQSPDYPAGDWQGGPGVPGTFLFSGGRPGIVAFEYRIAEESSGDQVAQGTAPADPSGAAAVTFTPADAIRYTLTVTGRTAEDAPTEEQTYSFGVATS